MARPYARTIATSTTAGSTTFPDGFHLLSITNDDGTNFVTLSFEATVGTTDNPEFRIDAGDSVSFNNINQIFPLEILYWDADTAAVNVSVVGFIG